MCVCVCVCECVHIYMCVLIWVHNKISNGGHFAHLYYCGGVCCSLSISYVNCVLCTCLCVCVCCLFRYRLRCGEYPKVGGLSFHSHLNNAYLPFILLRVIWLTVVCCMYVSLSLSLSLCMCICVCVCVRLFIRILFVLPRNRPQLELWHT